MQSHYSFVGVFVNFLVGVVGINATRTIEAEILNNMVSQRVCNGYLVGIGSFG